MNTRKRLRYGNFRSRTYVTPIMSNMLTILEVTRRVPGLSIRDCARGCNNRAQMCVLMSTIGVTAKMFFDCLYFVVELHKIALCVSCPCAPTTPTMYSATISRFLCNFSPNGPSFFCHDSPSNLAESLFSRARRGVAGLDPVRGVEAPWY